MNKEKYTCKDCVFFSLSSGGLDEDMCEFFNKPLKRDDVLKGKDCIEFRLREGGKGVEEYLPHKAKEKAEYKKETIKFIMRSIVLVIIGLAAFYYIINL